LDADTPGILVLLQLNKVMNKGFSATYSEGKPITEHMIIEKAKSFNDAMKIIDKW
jgi:Tc5 transposase DNA-binding domain.